MTVNNSVYLELETGSMDMLNKALVIPGVRQYPFVLKPATFEVRFRYDAVNAQHNPIQRWPVFFQRFLIQSAPIGDEHGYHSSIFCQRGCTSGRETAQQLRLG